jgi:hypothetical protein
MTRWDNARSLFLPALSIAAQVALLVPLLIFSGNTAEFSLGFLDLARHLVLPGAAGIALVLLLAAALPPRFVPAFGALVVALALLIYLQGNLLAWNYGQFDGQDIPWNEYGLRNAIDLALWIDVLVLSVLFRRWTFRQRKLLSLLPLLALSANALVVAAAQDLPWRRRPEPEAADRFLSYSGERNAILILLDAFASPPFDKILAKEPELKERLSGFTWYRNTLGAFPSTSPSVPAILSGQWYDNSLPLPEFHEAALRRSIPSLLSEQGFQTDLATLQPYCDHLDATTCGGLGQIFDADRPELELSELGVLLDTTLFRISPQLLKQRIFNDQAWLFQRWLASGTGPRHHAESLSAVERIERGARVGAERPTFKLIHLMIPHAPVRLDARCQPTEAAVDPRSFKAQCRCAVDLVERLLAVFRRLGIYDRSLILVFGDHGVNLNYSGDRSQQSYGLIVQALPLLLVKPFEAGGPLQISEAPAQITDIPKTVARALGIAADLPGLSLFDLSEGQERERIYRLYSWKHRFWRSDHLPPMQEYVVNGHAWDHASWAKGAVLLPADAPEAGAAD